MRNNKRRKTSAPKKPTRATSQTHLHDGLESLWRSRSQADVVVNVQDKNIPCHKAVLMAASPYFEAMFNAGMQEAISGEINFKDMDANTFELVLEFIYLGNYNVTKENGFTMLEAASLLQIQPLFRRCESILSQDINLDTCLQTWRFASLHNSRKLKTCAFKVILNQFEEFSKKDDFMTLTFDELYEIIQDDRLNVPTEEFVLKVALKWGDYSEGNKTKLGKLCSNLRLCQLSAERLFALKEYFTSTLDDKLAQRTIDKALQYKLLPAKRQATNSIITGYRNCNSVENVLVVIGGKRTAPHSIGQESILDVIAFSWMQSKWFKLAPLPFSCDSFFAVASNQEKIFITGGVNYEWKHLQYEAASNSWKSCTVLRTGRYAHAMVVLSEFLYIFGGCTVYGEDKKVLSGIEKYSFGTEKWTKCSDLVHPVAWPSATVTDTRVYIIGGVKKEDVESRSAGLSYQGSSLVQYLDIFTSVCCEITLPYTAGIKAAIQLDNHTYLFDEYGWIGKLNVLEKKSKIVGSGNIFNKDPRRYYSLVHMDGSIYVTFGNKDRNNYCMKEITVINSETWKQSQPVSLPYIRTIEGCARLTLEKKYLKDKVKA